MIPSVVEGEQANLPLRPSLGNRRRLDVLWLEDLERRGLSRYVHELPSQPPPELHVGVEQFNTGRYWECHETLEHVWRASPYPLRHFYHGLIKLAVGFLQVRRHNRKASRIKLSDGTRLLRVFRPKFMGLDLDRLCDESSAWLERVELPERINWAELDSTLAPVILDAAAK